jgi:TIR domain
MWVQQTVCRLLARNVGSLAATVSLTLRLLAPNASRKCPLFAGLSATVCKPLHLLILSEHSVQSRWVQKEVETAFEKEGKEDRIVLFPLRIDEAVMQSTVGWAADIRRQRHIGDFRQWKDHDAYQKAFQRLLRDLEAAI